MSRTIAIPCSLALLALGAGGWSMWPTHAETPASGQDRPAADAGQPEAREEPTIQTYDSENHRDADTTVSALAFSPDGATLAAGCRTGKVRFYDTATGRLRDTLRVVTAGSHIQALAYAPDGRTLAVGDNPGAFSVVGDNPGALSLWDIATGQPRAIFRQQGYYIRALAYAPDGKTLATAAFVPDGLCLWDAESGQLRAILRGHVPRPVTGNIYVSDLAFSPDSRTLVTASDDKTVRLWDVASGQLRATLEGPRAFYSVAFSPDGTTLAAGEWFQIPDQKGDRHAIRLWDVATRQERGLIEDPDHQASRNFAETLTFLSDGTTLASVCGSVGDMAVVQLWDSVDGSLLDGTAITRSYASSAVSPDGEVIAVGGYHSNFRFGSIDLLDVAEGKALRHREPVRED